MNRNRAKRFGVLSIFLLAVLVVPLAAKPPTPTAPLDAMKALGILETRQPVAAPDVTLPTLAGVPLAIKELKGKTVLVNFWATWCKPCHWEMPLMENLYQAYKDRGFVVLAISVDQQGLEAVRSLVTEKKLTFPVALDPQHEAARKFNITGIPATILIGPDGYIKGMTHGPRDWDGRDARALIVALLPARNRGATR